MLLACSNTISLFEDPYLKKNSEAFCDRYRGYIIGTLEVNSAKTFHNGLVRRPFAQNQPKFKQTKMPGSFPSHFSDSSFLKLKNLTGFCSNLVLSDWGR